ncbi:MAG: TonB family protein [Myxococcales bacterium]
MPSLSPPSVAQAVEAVYPPEALAQGVSADVDLLVTVAVDGSVLDAEVVQSAGQGFDEAAREALLHFRFAPARKDGQPVAARIRYRYQFAPPPPPPPPAPVPVTGRLVGKVVSERDGLAIVGAEVNVLDAAGQVRALVSDGHGAFALADLEPGPYQIQVSGPAFLGAAFDEEVRAGEETQVTYRLVARPEESDDSYEARAVVQAPSREVTRRTIERELMYRIPGTGNDPIRSVEVLPGVSRPPFGSGRLIIRGSSPQDSQVFLDGMPIPQLYHFGGLRSVYSGQLLRQISLYPGNFSSRYGRKMGGVFELETRDPQTDGLHGVVDVSAIDGSILLEGPLSRRFSLAGSVRRSLFDLIMRALAANGADTGFTALPVYYDYQLIGTYRTKRDLLRLQFYGSNDHLGLLAKDDREANASDAANAVNATSRFNFVQLSWKRPLSERTDQTIALQAGPTLDDVTAGTDLRLRLAVLQVYGRAEWFTRIGERMRLVNGVDVFTGGYRAKYSGPSFGQSEGNPYEDEGGQDEFGADVKGGLFQPGVYTDLGIDIGRLTINTALRADYYNEIRNYSIDPRLVAELRLSPKWTWKSGAGLYSQPPAAEESHPAVGNPKLDPIRSAQFSTGLNYQLAAGVRLGLEGFYKNIWDNVVSSVQPNQPKFINDGIGRVYGLEASAVVLPVTSRYSGLLSYTLLNSERKDHPGMDFRRFDYQQTHGLTAALMYLLPRGWDVGLTVRYFTGNPYTPVTGRVLNLTSRSYRPIYGAVNSGRNPAYNRLDLRIQKTWKARKHSTTLYLDVQNALNHKNQEAFFYNYDFTAKRVVNGLPIIPAIGVRGQF